MLKSYLEADEVEKLEKAATSPRDCLLVRLLFHLGCRVSEALALRVDDIDFEKGTVTIQHLKARTRRVCPQCGAQLAKGHSFCPGCGVRVDRAVIQEHEHRRMRTLPLDGDTLRLLKLYIRRGGPVTREDRTPIFGINRHRAWQIVRECARTVGLPKLINPETGRVHNVSPHRLRDAFAVYAMKHDDSGDGLRLLQEHLGHASFNTTARYRKVAGDEHRDWYDRLWQKGTTTKRGP